MLVRLLRAAIQTYWWLVPAPRRRRCLFSESCSRAVDRALGEGGLAAGARAFRARARACRPGFRVECIGAVPSIVLRDGTCLAPHEASDEMRSLLAAVEGAYLQLSAENLPRG